MFLKSRGFSLIEVLVTLIILMFGLLGLGALIIKGQQMGFEAYQRHIALNLVHDIAERMQANLYASYPTNAAGARECPEIFTGGAAATGVCSPSVNVQIGLRYASNAPLTTPAASNTSPRVISPDCRATQCNALERADYDVAIWERDLMGSAELSGSGAGQRRVGGLMLARGCIEQRTAVNNNTFRISVAWQGDLPTVAPATGLSCGSGIYSDRQGNLNDATRRVIWLDVTLHEPF